MQKSLYESVVEITYEYLGPAADRFVARQIKNHLKKEPDKLAKRDLVILIDWMQLAFSLVSDDEKQVVEYVRALKKLAQGNASRGLNVKNHSV